MLWNTFISMAGTVQGQYVLCWKKQNQKNCMPSIKLSSLPILPQWNRVKVLPSWTNVLLGNWHWQIPIMKMMQPLSTMVTSLKAENWKSRSWTGYYGNRTQLQTWIPQIVPVARGSHVPTSVFPSLLVTFFVSIISPVPVLAFITR